MSHPHIHIKTDGRVIGTAWVDHRGIVQDDGSKAASNALDHIKHAHGREHGYALLDDVVKRLDSSTMVQASYCHEDHLMPRHAEERKNTVPTEVMNPEDAWPDWGELTNEQKHPELQWGDDGKGLGPS